MDWSVIVAIMGGLAGIGSLISALAIWRRARPEADKLKADMAGQLTETAMELMKPLRARIRELERVVAEVRSENETLREQIKALQMENTCLYAQIGSKDEEVKRLTTEAGALKAKVQELSDQLKDFRNGLEKRNS